VGERSGDRDRLVAREAELADLESRLAAVSAARESELRRLNDKISSMERIYVEVEAGERRIEALEDEVKSLAESRDEALAELRTTEAELVRVRREHAESLAAADRVAGLQAELSAAQARVADLERTSEGPLQAELDRLRSTLAAERERSARIQRRSATAAEAMGPSSYAEFDRRLRRRIEDAVESATGPLLDRVEHLREVVEEKERRIASLTASRMPDDHDDLTLIRGIGPKIAAILHDLGVTTFHQIATFSDEDVTRIGSRLPVYGGRITDDAWIEQARTLAGED
jgi:predicted flap endonuclease-1-like 5' DNA nuclease